MAKATEEPIVEEEDSEAEAKGTAPAKDSKLVVTFRDGVARVALRYPGTDPHLQIVKAATFEEALKAIPAVKKAAEAVWKTAPQYVKYNPPAGAKPAPAPQYSKAPAGRAKPVPKQVKGGGTMDRLI